VPRNTGVMVAALVLMSAIVAFIGCDSKTTAQRDRENSEGLERLRAQYAALTTELQKTSGMGPELVTCASTQPWFSQPTTTEAGVVTAQFTGVSALEASRDFGGSYVQDASGVTLTLTGQGYTDGIERWIVLSLATPTARRSCPAT